MGVARRHVKSLPHFQPEVVIVSPTMRAMETASGIFGGDYDADNGGILMTSQQAEKVSSNIYTISFGSTKAECVSHGIERFQKHAM